MSAPRGTRLGSFIRNRTAGIFRKRQRWNAHRNGAPVSGRHLFGCQEFAHVPRAFKGRYREKLASILAQPVLFQFAL